MKNCPTCKQPVKMADGGDPKSEGSDAEDLRSGEGSEPTAEDKAAAEGSEPTAEDKAAAEGGDTPDDSYKNAFSGEDTDESTPKPNEFTLDEGDEDPLGIAPAKPGIPPKPAYIKPAEGGTIDVVGRKRPDFVGTGGDYNMGVAFTPPPAPTAQYMNAEDLGFASDLKMGKITPKTYSDLFASKSTLGKIGTLFGLMLSGAGSGLAHQPNALLDMMNKEIERDLDAQKASNTNTQNWYNLSLQHEFQKAQMNHLLYQNALTEAQTEHSLAGAYQSAAEADLSAGKTKRLGGKSFDLSATNAAKNRMMAVIAQHAQNIVNGLPPAMKPQGQSVLDTTVLPAIGNQVDQNNKKTAGALGFIGAGNGGGIAPTIDPTVYGEQLNQQKKKVAEAPPQQQGAINYKKLNEMVTASRNLGGLNLPPGAGISESDLAHINQEASGLEENRVAAKIYHDAFIRMNNEFRGGLLNPAKYKAEVSAVMAQMNQSSPNGFKTLVDASSEGSGIFPTWDDYSNSAETKYNNTMNYFLGKERATPTLNRFPALKTPFPSMTSPFPKDPTPPAPKKIMSDDQAMDWAKKHPDDPRSVKIMEKIKNKNSQVGK